MEQQTIDLIKKLQSGAANLTASKTDDDVLVIYRAKFDPETGAKLPSEVAGTVTQAQVADHVAVLEQEIASLNAFLTGFGLELPIPERKVSKTFVQDAFVTVLGLEIGVATWGWLWQQQYSGHPLIAYWMSYLQLASNGVDVNSNQIKSALQALLSIPGIDGSTPVLSGTQPDEIYAIIQAAVG